MNIARILLITCVLSLAGCAADVHPPDPALWGKLQAGQYLAGYGLKWETDPTRRDPATKAQRVMPVGVWYPARSSSAPHLQVGDYFELRTGQTQFDEPGAALDKLLHPPDTATMSMYTAATRDAPPAKGQYPVVIYSPDAEGAFSEDFILFEFLATHGFVVLSTTSVEGSRAPDMIYLMRFSTALGNVDATHAAAIGRGRGAEAVTAWAAQKDNPLDIAIVLRTPEDANPQHVLETLVHAMLRK